jgi:hypothetical protein
MQVFLNGLWQAALTLTVDLWLMILLIMITISMIMIIIYDCKICAAAPVLHMRSIEGCHKDGKSAQHHMADFPGHMHENV